MGDDEAREWFNRQLAELEDDFDRRAASCRQLARKSPYQRDKDRLEGKRQAFVRARAMVRDLRADGLLRATNAADAASDMTKTPSEGVK